MIDLLWIKVRLYFKVYICTKYFRLLFNSSQTEYIILLLDIVLNNMNSIIETLKICFVDQG